MVLGEIALCKNKSQFYENNRSYSKFKIKSIVSGGAENFKVGGSSW